MTAQITAVRRRTTPFAVPSAALAEAGALIRLAAPMAATALVNMGMSLTDVAMMGRLGPDAVAAGAIVSDLYSIVYYLGAGALAAVAPDIAQAIGANRRHEVRHTTQQGLWMAATMAVLALAILWNTPAVLALVGIDGSIIALADGYARMMALTAMPMMGVAIWRSVHGAVGHPRAFLIATLIALPANAALDQVLMFGGFGIPAFGLAGAGLASLIVATGMIVGLAVNAGRCAKLREFRIMARFAKPDRRHLAAPFRIGIPMGICGFTEVGVFLVSTMLAGLFGTEALAAHAVTLRMAGVVYALPVGLSQAATVRVGYAIGAGDAQAVRRAAKIAIALGGACGVAQFLVLIAGADALPWLFLASSDAAAPAVVTMAAGLLAILGVICLAQGVGVTAMGALRGFKDARVPMVIGAVGFWGVGMSTILLAGFALGAGVTGIWLGIGAGAFTTAGLTWLRLRRRLDKGVAPSGGADAPARAAA